MAEQFIEEIYKDAMIIEQVREYIAFTQYGRNRDAHTVYNQAAADMERILQSGAIADRELAEAIEQTAIEIRDSFEDRCLATALAEGRLLPLLYEYMESYAGIDVTEGKYTLRSANSAFLTVRDNEQNITMHSEYDPMWEAYQIASSIFVPEAECYHILGCGLGYLPYQLWVRSEGAVKIVIYEEDAYILDYAFRYGVLSWIAEKCIEVRHDTEAEMVADAFLKEKATNKKEERFYIAPWKKNVYAKAKNGEIAIEAANLFLERSMRERTAINLWKNKKHKQILFKEIKSSFWKKEWIVVSAGPSLDEQIAFLKESSGRRGIIAVNTVLRRLFREGIHPDLVAAADQDVQMRKHIDGIADLTEGIPLIAEYRLNWQYLEQYRGPACFVHTEMVNDEGTEEVWQVSGTVAGLALEAAVRLGAERIWLVGQDLAYPEGRCYADGMPHCVDADKAGTVLVPSVDGGMVATSEAFNWFRQGMEIQIARYKDVEFYNLSRHGALIHGCRTEINNQ